MRLPGDSEEQLAQFERDPDWENGEPVSDPDSGLAALASILAIYGIPVDPDQMRHDLGHDDPVDKNDLLRLAKLQKGVRVKYLADQHGRLTNLPLPALAHGPRGWFLIGRLVEDGVLVQFPNQPIRKVDREGLDALWSGEMILLTIRETTGALNQFDIRWFIPQIVRYRRLIGEMLLITLALNLLALAAPLLFQNVIDKVLVHHTMSTLNVLAFGFVAISLWEVAFGWLRTRLFSETSQKIDVELGARLFRHLLMLPLSYFEKRRVGDTVTRVRQLETVREFLTNASLSVLVDPAFAIVFLIAMFIYSPTLFWIAIISIVGYVAVSQIVTGPLRSRLDEKFERSAASNALLVESVSGIQTVKAAAVEPQWQDRWERQLAAYSAANQRVINLGNTGSQAVQLISKLTFAAILYFGAKEVIAGNMTVGALVAFNMFAQHVTGPVLRLAQLWQDFQQVRLSVERLGDVLNAAPEPRSPSSVTLPAVRGAVSFEGVNFRYGDSGAWTLDDINIDLEPGTMLGIVGSSGSGKSTLTKLLQRLYVPHSGRIAVDGIDISQMDPLWLRRQVGVVLQENLLFNRSIRENIALANPAMPLERIMMAADMAGAHNFIVSMPQGYDTPIVERGANLSGGQRQRIAIARALVTSPRILIFDEATSALDAESEEIIQRNLKDMAVGRTMLIIAHRLSAIRQCDKIIAMERGKIVETGTHADLLQLGGRYADLYRRQIGDQRELAA
jgi:ATP-binding cassette, subfamily B, bacterial HlyB/CyaB